MCPPPLRTPLEAGGTKLKKSYWDYAVEDVMSLGLSPEDAQSMKKQRRQIKGATGYRRFTGDNSH